MIGIVGGVASGKSAVAAQFAKLGAYVIDGDKLGHEVLQQPEVMVAARQRWGTAAIAADGNLDRHYIAARVFQPTDAGREELAFWEGVMHPRITKALDRQLADLPEETIVILDAAVMFKAAWDQRCDHIVFVDVSRAQRMERAVQHRGWTAEQFEQREAAQLPVADKRHQATTVIDNSGSLDQTYMQVVVFWQSLSQ
jgi:dephospho-CoA kinase